MRIQLAAYAADCIATGSFELGHDRLADHLAALDVIPTAHASVRAIDDGRSVELAELSLHRSEICLVVAAGPRGDAARRLATVRRAVRATVGPYEVLGRLHGPASTNPFVLVRRRRWIAITDVVVRYRSRGRFVSVAHDAVLVNTDALATIEEIDELDLDVALSRRPALRPAAIGLAAFGRPGAVF